MTLFSPFLQNHPGMLRKQSREKTSTAIRKKNEKSRKFQFFQFLLACFLKSPRHIEKQLKKKSPSGIYDKIDIQVSTVSKTLFLYLK